MGGMHMRSVAAWWTRGDKAYAPRAAAAAEAEVQYSVAEERWDMQCVLQFRSNMIMAGGISTYEALIGFEQGTGRRRCCGKCVWSVRDRLGSSSLSS